LAVLRPPETFEPIGHQNIVTAEFVLGRYSRTRRVRLSDPEGGGFGHPLTKMRDRYPAFRLIRRNALSVVKFGLPAALI
jgi:hypothetical protein